MNNQRVVIVGGGFGGLYAAKRLGNTAYQVTLIDKRNFHLFQPLLYQVATGGLSPGEIASPLRHVLAKKKNITVLLGEVREINVERRVVQTQLGAEPTEVPYDVLIVAAGSRHHYFGHDEWEKLAPGLKTVEDATEIRRRVLYAFEAAEREHDPEKRREWLTFIIIGGGPTGVELAGALGEIANDTLRNDFRSINPAEANIILFEGSGRVLGTFPEDLSHAAERSLIKLGVRARPGVVVGLDERGVDVKAGDQTIRVNSRTVLWAAGVKSSPLGAQIAGQTGAQLDRGGRVMVEPDLTAHGHPEIFVIGDMAAVTQDGRALPGVAPVAMQQGRYVADVLANRLHGRPTPPFHYRDKGNLATIGRASAVADVFGLKFSGLIAWLLWLFIHIMYLVEFDNRLLVLTEWTYNYFTKNRGARLITGKEAT
jgi:NADH dehydrogenase